MLLALGTYLGTVLTIRQGAFGSWANPLVKECNWKQEHISHLKHPSSRHEALLLSSVESMCLSIPLLPSSSNPTVPFFSTASRPRSTFDARRARSFHPAVRFAVVLSVLGCGSFFLSDLVDHIPLAD